MSLHSIQILGSGTYGSVYLVEDDKGNRYAQKNFYNKTDEFLDIGILGDNLRDIDILSRLDHPNVSSSLDVFLYPDRLPSVLLHLADTSLWDFLYHLSSKNLLLDSYQIQYMCFQLSCGLYYLHNNHIIHRDIKPGNILIKFNVDDKGFINGITPIIADFGFGIIYYGKKVLKTPRNEIVTYTTRPPEFYKKDNTYTDKVDVWSMGITFFNIATTLEFIYPGEDAINTDISQQEINQFLDENIKESNLCDLLKNMLQLDPKKRYNSKKVLSHKYFENMYKKYMCHKNKTLHKIPLGFPIKPLDNSSLETIVRNRFLYDINDYNMNFHSKILGVDIYDRFMSSPQGMLLKSESSIQKVLLTCLHIALKMDFDEYGDTHIITNDIKKLYCVNILEQTIILSLHFQIYRPTLDVVIHDQKKVVEYLLHNRSPDEIVLKKFKK